VEEMKLGLAICTRGTEYNFCLSGLHRFLESLYASDMPTDTIVSLAWVPETPEQPTRDLKFGRRRAILNAMLGTDAVLLTETDVMVPKVWWKPMEKALLDDQTVGMVVPSMDDSGKGGPAVYGDYYIEDVWYHGQETFVIFRKEFLFDGLKDDPTPRDPGARFAGFPFSLQRLFKFDEVHRYCVKPEHFTCPRTPGAPTAKDGRHWNSKYVPEVRIVHTGRAKY
jgi:hypothetical protein